MKHINVKQDDYTKWIYDRENHYVQDLFPYLSADERELLVSGVCGKCYDEMFTEEE